MVKIRNRKELLSNAYSSVNRRGREIVLDVIERSLEAVDPKRVVRSQVNLSNSILKVDEETFNLTRFRRIFVVGGGKAGGSMAEALDKILGERIEDGIIVIPKGTLDRYQAERIDFHEGSHPIPDESSVKGAKKILNLASRAEKNDLVMCLISGGGSSLMALPREGISLRDKRKVTDLLLRSGAAINEINTIRKHISSFKGGQLAREAYPATVISLLLSDVIGDPLDVIASGPTVPDPTTFEDAVTILRRYSLWEATPKSIKQTLSNGAKGIVQETPKEDDPAFAKARNLVIGNNRLACTAAVGELERHGLNTLLLTSLVEGEARDVGLIFGGVARETLASGCPLPPPAGIVAGGETTVTVTGDGVGGRNQEICLSAALKIDGLDRVVMASVSTDGIDGPTDAAGAVVDGRTISRSRDVGIDAKECLRNNDAYSFFSGTGDLIYTGPTGTNVNDITILVML